MCKIRSEINMIYLYIKTLHIVSVVAWFAGLLYLPRLFIYHQEAFDQISIERFRVMERRLYFGIMWPSAISTTLLGVWLVFLQKAYIYLPWLHYKILAVLLIWVFHGICGRFLKILTTGKLRFSGKFLRFYNEIPMVILIFIVWLVVSKPSV